MHLGFTGTRNQITINQKAALRELLLKSYLSGFRYLHHGDCVGADATAHELALKQGFKVIIHPPEEGKLRANCNLYHEIRKPKSYLERNKDIVWASDLLIVVPGQTKEILRSGTWSTKRFAERMGKEFHILWP